MMSNDENSEETSSVSSTSPSREKYQIGEEVFCYYGQYLYKAKCEVIDPADPDKKYFVHYCGWKKIWDEWVPEERLLKYNEANLAKQKRLLEASASSGKKAKSNAKKRKSESVLETTSEENSSKKIKLNQTGRKVYTRMKKLPSGQPQLQADSSDTSASTSNKEKEGQTTKIMKKKKLTIPEELENKLLHDYEFLTEQKKLVVLPAKKTVDNILKEYTQFKISSKGYVPTSDLLDYYAGMQEYFNVLLPKQLLYGFERFQHAEIAKKHPNMPLTEIYGGIHLLRLFVKLQSVIPTFDEESQRMLLTYTQDFVKFIQKNSASLFTIKDYFKPTQVYCRKAIKYMKSHK